MAFTPSTSGLDELKKRAAQARKNPRPLQPHTGEPTNQQGTYVVSHRIPIGEIKVDDIPITLVLSIWRQTYPFQCGAVYYANPNLYLLFTKEDAERVFKGRSRDYSNWYDVPHYENGQMVQRVRKWISASCLRYLNGGVEKKLYTALYSSKDESGIRKLIYQKMLRTMHNYAGSNLVTFSDQHQHEGNAYSFWDIAEKLKLPVSSESFNHNSRHRIKFWHSIGTASVDNSRPDDIINPNLNNIVL